MKKKISKTNMCLLYNDEGKILVMNRVKSDWPGLTFPGGHILENEEIKRSVIREFYEETGLEISNLEFVGIKEWVNQLMVDRCYLYRTKTFRGDIKSSIEGEVFWIDEEEIKNYSLSTDFIEIYNILKGMS